MIRCWDKRAVREMNAVEPQPDRRCGLQNRVLRAGKRVRALPCVSSGGGRRRRRRRSLRAGERGPRSAQSRGGARGGGRARLSHPVLGRRCAGGWREREPQRQRPLAPGGGGGGGAGGRGALGGQGGGHGGRHGGRRARQRARHHQRRAPQETPRHHQLLRGQFTPKIYSLF